MKKNKSDKALLKAISKELKYFYEQYPCESSPVLLKSVEARLYELEWEQERGANRE